MTKHTPSPWILHEWDSDLGYDCMTGGLAISGSQSGPGEFHVLLDGNNYGQAACDYSWQPTDRMLADAKLIAAAPDLLAALQLLVGRRESIATDPASRDGSDGRYAIARAAIAKATARAGVRDAHSH